MKTRCHSPDFVDDDDDNDDGGGGEEVDTVNDEEEEISWDESWSLFAIVLDIKLSDEDNGDGDEEIFLVHVIKYIRPQPLTSIAHGIDNSEPTYADTVCQRSDESVVEESLFILPPPPFCIDDCPESMRKKNTN